MHAVRLLKMYHSHRRAEFNPAWVLINPTFGSFLFPDSANRVY